MGAEKRASGEPPEVESLLRAGSPGGPHGPVARPEFRAACREAFLAAASDVIPGSQAETSTRSAGVVEHPIESALRADPRLPEARPEFRVACAERFLAAAAADEGTPVRVESATSPRRHAAGDREAAPRSTPRGRLVRFAAVLAGVAAALLVTRLPDRPRWRLVEVGGAGPVHVAGRPILAQHAGEVDDDVRLIGDLGDGARVQSGEATFDVVLDDWLTLHVRAGTELEFGRLVEFEEERVLRLALESGEIFLSADPTGKPVGSTILIETLDGTVEVTGTSLGILTFPGATCVCVARGSVRVSNAESGEVEEVGPCSKFLFTCGPDGVLMRAEFEGQPTAHQDDHTNDLLEFAARH